MNKDIITKEKEIAQNRNFKISVSLNEKEYNTVCRYIDKYKISDKSRWLRETILMHVLTKLEENHPTLFDDIELRR